MYLFTVFAFRCKWITHFFVTHQIIAQRLKAINNNITYSTEREHSARIGSESTGSGIGTRIKKSRNAADANEIEKELQDILTDMQRIPIVMCRPNIVIVFDELDKVEPGDADVEKEAPQTKASLFSITATRERQTEILRILSNMKYFLSTVQAKFIFIAGREMYDIHLADVSERDNHIGSIFNAVIHVPSFLTDHPKGESLREESSIVSMPEEFVCRRLIPRDYPVSLHNLKSYQKYLNEKIFEINDIQDTEQQKEIDRKINKIIAVLQQFIIYLAHVSKGAPKKMLQLFESFVDVGEIDRNKEEKYLVVQRYHSSRHFLSFSYYRQYTLGIIAYLITPIFYRLAESNIKEHSDKLLVSSLRFVDFLFKFYKYSFSWKHLEISPEMIEANRAPELKSVAMDLLNYLTQQHINKSNFSFYDYKFDSWIANEIFTMTKTDDLFSALFNFSLDETLSLKKYYQDILEVTEKKYQIDNDDKTSVKYIDAISSLQIVLGDLYYYSDELEEAAVCYKDAVEMIDKGKDKEIMSLERLYLYVRNKLKLGMIHERRRQYDFAYLTYGEVCERIIQERIYMRQYDNSFQKMTFEGLKQFYVPFIARLQILEQSHIGGITGDHLEQLEDDHKKLALSINHENARLLDAEFYSRVADILYYKNSDLMCKKDKNRMDDDELNCERRNDDKENLPTNSSCTACHYYHKALSILLRKYDSDQPYNDSRNTVVELLRESVNRLEGNYDMKYCTILARILSDWGNVFFSCDSKGKKGKCGCYICDAKDCDTKQVCYHCNCYICDYDECETNNLGVIFRKYVNYVNDESKKENRDALLARFYIGNHLTKLEIAFAMYSISSEAFRNANLYKRSAYQIYKMLRLFKFYNIYKCERYDDYLEPLSRKAIHYLWYANEDLNVLELNKRKKDFDKIKVGEYNNIPLQDLLIDSEITKIRVLVKELKLGPNPTSTMLKEYYDLYITSPYKINYSIGGRIYRLHLKSKLNYKTYRLFLEKSEKDGDMFSKIDFILRNTDCNDTATEIFGKHFNIDNVWGITVKDKVKIFENLIADSIYSLIDIVQLSKTMGEMYVFTNSFLGSVHKHLSFWIRLYETYELYKKDNPEIDELSRIGEYLKRYLDEEWREQLSGYRENQRALSHYYQSLEMHSGGRAYHDIIDTMRYLRGDYNDRSDHFNIAEERHLIVNGVIEDRIKDLKDVYKDSRLYDADNYYDRG
jgi:hypothetical protein